MEELKEYILSELTDLHVAIHYGTGYGNSENGVYKKLRDIVEYKQLKRLVGSSPCFDSEEMGRELSNRVKKRTSLWLNLELYFK